MLIETILQIQNGIYPFEDNIKNPKLAKVEDVLEFVDENVMAEKKTEMQKKAKMIDSPYMIKLLKIYQDELSLHLIYEYVPYSIGKYIEKHYKDQKYEIIQMSEKLFLKKMSYELTLLISYLAKMKMEVDLSIDNLGITDDEKLKLFMNAKCKMGRKTELSLVSFYGQCKEKILTFIESQFELLQKKEVNPPNFVIKGNRLLFPTNILSESIYEDSQNMTSLQSEDNSNLFNNSTQESNIFKKHNPFYSSINLKKSQPEPASPTRSKIRETDNRIPTYNRSCNFSESKYPTKTNQKKNRYHKNSFQFGTSKAEEQSQNNKSFENDNSDTKSYTHSKSIRIELEQKIDQNQKRKRKDSYRVKIITSHEYEMDDCNPQDFFGKNPENEEDIFDHFAKRAKKEEKKEGRREERREKQFSESDEYNSESAYDDFVPQSPTFSKRQSQPEFKFVPMNTKNLEQKIRMAKQKAQTVMSKYLKSGKKASSFNI